MENEVTRVRILPQPAPANQRSLYASMCEVVKEYRELDVEDPHFHKKLAKLNGIVRTISAQTMMIATEIKMAEVTGNAMRQIESKNFGNE